MLLAGLFSKAGMKSFTEKIADLLIKLSCFMGKPGHKHPCSWRFVGKSNAFSASTKPPLKSPIAQGATAKLLGKMG